MAAGLAHELNQPLTAIHFEAAAALELPPGETAAGMREALATIAEQALRAGEIVRRMRSFARHGDARRAVTDLRPLVRDVLALLAHDLRLNGIATTETLAETRAVLVDRIEVQQVAVNLIRNAIEAMAHTAMRDRHLTIDLRDVDDEEIVRNSLGRLLRAIGLSSRGFASGEAVLEQYRGDERGCPIVDIRMPGMSGLDLLEALQQRGSALPAIVITGHTDEGWLKRLETLQTVGVLEKPFSLGQLKEMLARCDT